MIEETTLLFGILVLNLIMIIAIRLPLLIIFSSLISAIIGLTLTDVYAFPFLNMLVVLTCIYGLVAAITKTR